MTFVFSLLYGTPAPSTFYLQVLYLQHTPYLQVPYLHLTSSKDKTSHTQDIVQTIQNLEKWDNHVCTKYNDEWLLAVDLKLFLRFSLYREGKVSDKTATFQPANNWDILNAIMTSFITNLRLHLGNHTKFFGHFQMHTVVQKCQNIGPIAPSSEENMWNILILSEIVPSVRNTAVSWTRLLERVYWPVGYCSLIS